MGFMDWLTGTVSNGTFNGLPQVQNPNAGSYQIQGMPQYQQTLQGLSQQAAGNNINTANADQTRGQQEQNLGQLQAQANGQHSYAQAFMQQNQQAALRAQQAQALSSQAGATPGLAYRGLMNAQGALQSQMASQGALMQVQEQQQAQQNLASQLSNMRQQDFGQAQGVAQQTSNNIAQQGQLAGQGFSANAQQTQNNMTMNQQQMALQEYQRNQALQQAQAQAAEGPAMLKAGAGLVGGVAGAMMGNPMGLLGGASALGSMGGGGGGGGGGMPISSGMLNQMGGGGGGFQLRMPQFGSSYGNGGGGY